MDTTYRRPIAWESCAQTHVGVVRQVNEDSILAKPDIGLWAVADGMGGHHVGDIASQKIVTALDEFQSSESLATYIDQLENTLLDVNQGMLEYAEIMFDNETMGSTLVSLVIKGRVGVCLWAGDSRLYRYRNRQLEQLTRDHSQIEEMIEMGIIERSAVDSHPQRNVITRAIGVESQIYLDINVFTTQVGDIYMLCSDGLYNAVDESDIAQVMSIRDVTAGVGDLIHKAIENGAPDNVSVILVQGNLGRVPGATVLEQDADGSQG